MFDPQGLMLAGGVGDIVMQSLAGNHDQVVQLADEYRGQQQAQLDFFVAVASDPIGYVKDAEKRKELGAAVVTTFILKKKKGSGRRNKNHKESEETVDNQSGADGSGENSKRNTDAKQKQTEQVGKHNDKTKSDVTDSDADSSEKTSRAARREAMRDEGIPTSQQPDSQSQNASGREYTYTVPAEGGGTKKKSVQQQTMDSSHEDQPHWEAGDVKTDPLTGETRMNNYDRPKLENNKSKVEYNEK